MKEFWNNRYSQKEFAFGVSPNNFFRQELDKLEPGRILLPAEGEGRNAVYAASRGWEVTAFDISDEGRKKADILSGWHDVKFDFHILGFDEFDSEANTYDCLALIYAHIHRARRRFIHRKLITYLKYGGTLILEGFSKEQITRNTGGPGSVDMLYSREDLAVDFESLTSLSIIKALKDLDEGVYHKGEASVIQLIGIK